MSFVNEPRPLQSYGESLTLQTTARQQDIAEVLRLLWLLSTVEFIQQTPKVFHPFLVLQYDGHDDGPPGARAGKFTVSPPATRHYRK
jgi:hypothetical protein